MANAKVVIDVDDAQLNAKLRQAERNIQQSFQKMANSGSVMDNAIKKTGQSADVLNNQFASLKGQLSGLVSVAVIGSFVKNVAQVRGEFQKYEAVLANTFQDEAKAAESMEMIASYAAKTNFQVSELTDSYVRLAGQGFKPTREEMAKLGDLAASKAKGFTQLSEAIIDAETFEFERLKEFGIRAAKDGEQITFTFKGIKTTVDASAESIRNYILSLGELDGVRGSTEAISKTIVGLASNFEDAWDKMLNTIGQSNEGAFADSIKLATQLVSNYDAVVDSLKVLIATYGAYKAAVIVNKILAEAEAAGTLTKALKQTAIARRLLNVANAASPVGLALAGITALVGGFLVYQKHLKNTNTFTQELNRSISDEVISLNSLFGKLKETQTGTQERADTIKLTNERYGDYLGNLLTEKSTLEEIEIAQRNATNALIANISVQKSKDKLSEVLGDVSDKFDKEFSGFISKFGEVYGTDRIPEFVTAINSAIDTKIKEGGGKVERGMLEYSNIAKDVYDDFVKEISQKTGYLQFGFDDFQESFLDFAEFKAEKSGFIATLEGMISSYQGVLNKFNKSGGGSTDDGGDGDDVTNITDKIKELRQQLSNADGEQQKAIAARIVKLQNELFLREQIAELTIQTARNEAGGTADVPQKINSKGFSLTDGFKSERDAVKATTLEVDKLNKRLAERKKLAGVLGFELEEEEFQKLLGNVTQIFDVTNRITQQYREQLGLTEEQATVIEGGLQAMSGIADIATGNYIQGAAKLIESSIKLFVKVPEEMNVKFEEIQQRVNKIIKSVEIAGETLANLNDTNVNNALSVVSSQLQQLSSDAATLNKELGSAGYGRRPGNSTSVIYGNLIDQATDLNSEIDKLTQRLLKGNLSDAQREAIESLLESYNSLLAQIDDITRELTGTTVSEFATALSDAVIDGADAWNVWEEKAIDVIRRVTSQQLASEFLTDPITDAIDALVKASSNGLDANEASDFTETIKAIYEQVGPAYEAAIKALQAAGINITDASKESGYSAITGSTISATEESVSLLYGQAMAMRVDLKSIADSSKLVQNQLEMMDQSLGVLQNIEKNTRHNARLETIESNIAETNKILKERL